MGQEIRKYRAEGKDFLTIFNNTTDVFDTPFFRSPEELGDYIKGSNDVFIDVREAIELALNTEVQYELSREKLSQILNITNKLKQGINPSEEEAIILCEAFDFVKTCIELSQTVFPEESQVAEWVEKLGLYQQFDNDWNASDILDAAEWIIYQQFGHYKKWKSQIDSGELPFEVEESSHELKILAGLYLELLINILKKKILEQRKKIGHVLGIPFFGDDYFKHVEEASNS